MWTLDELRAVTDTAHDLDTPTIAHCRNAKSTRLAAEAGVDLILHASFLDEAALAAVVEAGCAVAPTFTFLANLADHGDKVGRHEHPGRPVPRRDRGHRHDAARPPTTPACRSSCGSESGFALTPYGHWHAREMEVLVDAMGLTPLEAIRCATHNGAHGAAHGRRARSASSPRARPPTCWSSTATRRPTSTVLGDRANLRHVISRGRPVDLDRPWPERRAAAGREGRPVGDASR